jgi:MFS transporter, MFS domain-containing protein family, molybdate-anion transporter
MQLLHFLFLYSTFASVYSVSEAFQSHLSSKIAGLNKLNYVTSPTIATSPHSLLKYRGGSVSALSMNLSQGSKDFISSLVATPDSLFNTITIFLVGGSLLWRFIESNKYNRAAQENGGNGITEKPSVVKLAQFRFLIIFWLLRMADWLQGPFFYEVYSSKLINGLPVSLEFVSKLFLVGFASTGIFGPWMGRFVDSVGRKAGTLLCTLLYSLGALSTKSNSLFPLLLGRLSGGVGTSLLFSAPEAWLVGDFQREQIDGKYLGQTFGWAYAGDSLVAILAGQLASWAVTAEGGATGPFSLSVAFLIAAAFLVVPFWTENTATKATQASTASPTDEKKDPPKLTIQDAFQIMIKDKKILSLGIVQALFEGAMYIFVLQWPPAMKAALQSSAYFNPTGATLAVPYGKIFSSLMASCLLGSTIFSSLQRSQCSTEQSSMFMLGGATIAMFLANFFGLQNAFWLIPSFLLFEVAVGMYFPSIGTLRSQYLPDSHRSVIMNLFGIPLNLIVVSVFLSIKFLGIQGALSIATCALAIATCSMWRLTQWKKQDQQANMIAK